MKIFIQMFVGPKLFTLTLLGAVLFVVSGWFPAPALAVDFPVPCSDDGPERFLFRIVEANNNPGPDRIILADDCIYRFNRLGDTTAGGNALPVITDDLVIEGNGAILERVSGGQVEFRLLRIENEARVTLKNLTLRNGRLTTPSGQGGGLFAGTRTELTLINVSFEGNKGVIGGGLRAVGKVNINGGQFVGNTALTGSGGGISAIGPITLTDVIVRDNIGQTGGGGLAAGGTVQIRGGEFRNNRAVSGSGGGISAIHPISMVNTAIIGNHAESDGGGLAAHDLAEVTLDNVHFFDNQSRRGRGGGVYAFTTVTLRNTQVISNAAWEFGGGLYTEASAAISDARFERNKAFSFSSGGGLLVARDLSLTRSAVISNAAFAGGGVVAAGRLNLSNNRFELNAAFDGAALFAGPLGEDNRIVNNVWLNNTVIAEDGGPVLLRRDSAADKPLVAIIHNTIVATTTLDHAAVVVNNVNVRLQNSIVGNYKGGLAVEQTGQIDATHNLLFGEPFTTLPLDGGNIIAEPQFVNLAGGDLHLLPSSPAIDAGLNAGLAEDHDGNTRPQGAGFDLGAFEFVAAEPTPPPTPTPDPAPNPNPGGEFTLFLPLVVK